MSASLKPRRLESLRRIFGVRQTRAKHLRKIAGVLTNPYATWTTVTLLALALVGLRIHIVDLQYYLGSSSATERQLMERERDARIELTEMKDPKQLLLKAQERGFERTNKVIHIPLRDNGYRKDHR